MTTTKVTLPDYEKLGAFYLGRLFDPSTQKPGTEPLLYDSKDLTTHAVCLGMTGSGKTGLCVTLLEEAAIDGIPALVIDPKGDLANLALQFPKLRAADFRPWIEPDAALRKGRTVDEQALATAELWRGGLAEWGQDGARIQRLKDAAEVAVYTPGSTAGRSLTVLRSFGAPPAETLKDGDLLRERLSTVVSGLLALMGIDADPVQSREHILLSSILQDAWRAGRSPDLAELIRQVQSPPFERVGVLDLETFFPSRDRLALSMALNNLLASPGFAGWLEGEALDVGKLLWTADGRPRLAVLSIAHLSDAERMFFVTLLLNEVVGWMRSRSGTSSLRALLYMDEVFGYLPPTANPPSKKPLLTLMKQARAFGVGVVLATQNPVDLDYKALSNAGTWMLGRLQTERDKMRVLDGLESVATGAGGRFDRKTLEATLSSLKSRVFLMNNVHENEPVLFHSRWALSYLRGPLTREQIATLDAASPGDTSAVQAPAARPAVSAPPPKSEMARAAEKRPLVADGIDELFVPADGTAGGDERLVYRPSLLAEASLRYVHARSETDEWRTMACVARLAPRTTATAGLWDKAETLEAIPGDFFREPEPEVQFGPLPAVCSHKKSFKTWEKTLKSYLYRNHALTLWSCPTLKLVSTAGESEADFRVRVREATRERRDEQIEKLRRKFAPRVARLQERIRTAQERVDREGAQYSQQKMQTAISLGATVLGALFGRKAASIGTVGRATTTLRGVGRASRERGDVDRARLKVKDLSAKLEEMESDLQAELDRVRDEADIDTVEVKETAVRPRKTDLAVARMAVLWTPWRMGADGSAVPATADTG